MAITLTWGGTDLNDGSTYTLLRHDFGYAAVTYEELPDYTGAANKQVNPRRASIIPMTIELMVTASSASARDTAIAALDTLTQAEATLVYNDGGTELTYTTLVSDAPVFNRDYMYYAKYDTIVTLNLLREAS